MSEGFLNYIILLMLALIWLLVQVYQKSMKKRKEAVKTMENVNEPAFLERHALVLIFGFCAGIDLSNLVSATLALLPKLFACACEFLAWTLLLHFCGEREVGMGWT